MAITNNERVGKALDLLGVSARLTGTAGATTCGQPRSARTLGFRSYWAVKALGWHLVSTNGGQKWVRGADVHRYQHRAWSVLTR